MANYQIIKQRKELTNMNNKQNKREYNDLSKGIKSIFSKLGFKEIEGRGKPYYAGLTEGKIYRVIGNNKLKELKDGATPTEYGYVKLKQLDGTFKDEAVHRIICSYKENPQKKWYVNHLAGLRNRNKLSELEWATPSENMQHYHKNKRAKEGADYQ